MKPTTKDKQLANRMINMLQKAGFTPDQMIEVLQASRKRYLQMQLEQQKN